MRREIELLAHGAGRIEREAEVTAERVGASEGKDADRRRRMMCEPLDDLVQCAIAAAGEDEVGAVADRIGSLRAGRPGAMGCDDLYLDAVAEKDVCGALDHAEA